MSSDDISLNEIKKNFGVTCALDGCSFSASLGEIHAIVGGNGSGKSTLAKVISGVLPPDSGQISILGHTPTSPHSARSIGISTVYQEVLVAEECSVVDNLYLGADKLFSSTISTKVKQMSAQSIMNSLVGKEVDITAMVNTLPLSIKQWITIARALLTRPRILILDESSAALDLDSTERLFAKMRELRDQGTAVLIVTHRIAELIRISDRATVLCDGKNVGVLDKKDITEQNLLSLMTGKKELATTSTSTAPKILDSEVVMRACNVKWESDVTEIDFSLHSGEVLGLVGLDGQGQDEFIRALSGVQQNKNLIPEVLLSGKEFVPIKDLNDATLHGVAYVSGDRKREGIFANLSIYENLLMPLYRSSVQGGKLSLIDWRALTSVFDWEVERLDVRMGSRNNKITSLSGGNQQKVLIGRAFALRPNILLLNDPARGVDVGAKTELYKHLIDYAKHGKSVVYLSSEIEEFVGFCNRVIVFRNGGIFTEFSGSNIEPTRILEAMFGQVGNTLADKQEYTPKSEQAFWHNAPPWIRQAHITATA